MKALKVLILEDCRADQAVSRHALKGLYPDVEIVTAEKMGDILPLAGYEFDLALVDLKLKCGTDPVEIVRRVHGLFPSANILVISGLDDEELARVIGQQEGVIKYVSKTLIHDGSKSLADMIKQVLEIGKMLKSLTVMG